ncbi:MAG: type II toxin-antitoxin system YafQ family toxin [Clostridia bacterium]|nr:type II toxin-antitoxin system YafQ family toxin [Clostridia bacterium]
MKYTVKFTKQFKKDYKKAQRQHKDIRILKNVVEMLANGEQLPESCCDHILTGNYRGKRECHLEPDWLLIYEYDGDELILWLARTGSHSELF